MWRHKDEQVVGQLFAFEALDDLSVGVDRLDVLIGITSALLLGYVTTWYAALQRAPVTLVTGVLVGGALVTSVLSTVRLGSLPATPVAAGLLLLALGVVMAAWSTLRHRAAVPTARSG